MNAFQRTRTRHHPSLHQIDARDCLKGFGDISNLVHHVQERVARFDIEGVLDTVQTKLQCLVDASEAPIGTANC